MDLNGSGFILNPSALHSVYCQAKDDEHEIIDLGLSLRTVQPEAYAHSTGHLVSLAGYDNIMNWNQPDLYLKGLNAIESRSIPAPDCDREAEGVQSKQQCWAYVKVNMDGVIVGRKICVLNHESYSSLAIQLEDMFGRQSVSGLRLFQTGSEFSLFFQDRHENRRTVGDVPWKEFVECVKRLRIARKIEAHLPSSSEQLVYDSDVEKKSFC